MTASDVAAWWGAAVATFLAFWEIYKWLESGPKVRISARANMRSTGIPRREKLVSVRAVNVGDAATTLTLLGMIFYPSLLARLRRRPVEHYVIGNPVSPNPLPFKLEPGAIWDGEAIQTPEIEQMAQSGHLFVVLQQAGDKPVHVRLLVKKSSSSKVSTFSKSQK
jgi:hypothetical protein